MDDDGVLAVRRIELRHRRLKTQRIARCEARTRQRVDVVILKRAVRTLLEIHVDVSGQGKRRFTVRSDNVRFQQPERVVDLDESGSATLSWNGEIESRDAPWVVVVLPDRDLTRRREIVGLRP